MYSSRNDHRATAQRLIDLRNRRILEAIARGEDLPAPDRGPGGKVQRGLSAAGMVLIDQLERRLAAMGAR